MKEKIILGGYEQWLDIANYPSLIIYGSEKAQHGMCVDVVNGSISTN